MKNIFISYAPQNLKRLKDMQDALLQNDYKPWIDPEPRPGQDWKLAIDEAIQASDALIVILTPESANSIYVTYEWGFALGNGIPVIPIIFKPCRFHPRLAGLTIFDVAAWTDENHFWDYFLRELPKIVGQRPVRAGQPVRTTSAPSSAPQVAKIPTYDKQVMPSQPGHWIVVRRGPLLNEMFKLEKDVTSLGRDANNDITINDPEVSRHHARFSKRGNLITVEDLGTTNGTAVNTQLVQGARALTNGDAIMLGDAILLSYEVVI